MFDLDGECKFINNKTLQLLKKYVPGCHIGWVNRRFYIQTLVASVLILGYDATASSNLTHQLKAVNDSWRVEDRGRAAPPCPTSRPLEHCGLAPSAGSKAELMPKTISA